MHKVESRSGEREVLRRLRTFRADSKNFSIRARVGDLLELLLNVHNVRRGAWSERVDRRWRYSIESYFKTKVTAGST
jgi:hypothetical protein